MRIIYFDASAFSQLWTFPTFLILITFPCINSMAPMRRTDPSHCIHSTSRSLSYISVSYIMSIIQKSVDSHANGRFDISFCECWCRNLDTLCRFSRVSIHAHYSCKLHIRILDLVEPNLIRIRLDYHDS